MPSTTRALVRDRLAGQQAHQVRLAGAVRATRADALAEVHLLGQAALSRPSIVDIVAGRSRAAPSRRPAAAGRICWSTTGAGGGPVVDEAPPAGLRGVGALGPVRRVAARSLKRRTISRSRLSSAFQRASRSPISSWRRRRASE